LRRSVAVLLLLWLAAGVLSPPLSASGPTPPAPKRKPLELEVAATAYNSLPGQTEDNPHVTAWGDRLAEGDRAIAVSPDLIDLGLTRGVEVEIQGLEGAYRVLDKMPPRWTRRIDIYMGRDLEAALAWGRRTVLIRWHGSSPASDLPQRRGRVDPSRGSGQAPQMAVLRPPDQEGSQGNGR